MTSMPAPVDSDIVFVASCNVDLVRYYFLLFYCSYSILTAV